MIGAGVSGLTCAYQLAENGHDVIVIADKDASQTSSTVAGALWEWPPAVCGHHTDSLSLQRSKPWCIESYNKFNQLSRSVETGVKMETACFYFFCPVEQSDFEKSKMEECQDHVEAFRHDASLIEKNRVGSTLGLVDAYSYRAPVIHTPIYMKWLKNSLLARGIQFISQKLVGPLCENLNLLKEHRASTIINCTGLGSHELADDDVFPLRGALIQVDPHSAKMISGAHCITHDDAKPHQNMIYVVPRGQGLLLGGIAEPREWDEHLTLENDLVKEILSRCLDFMPDLNQFSIPQQQPVLVGLRPARKKNVRLEREQDLPVIHNYGHGGSGFSLSWGCAKEVASLV